MKRITNFFFNRWHRMVLVFGAGTLLASVALAPKVVKATVPKLINFQGILKDGSGNPVPDAVYVIRFRIYDDSTAGTNLWEEFDDVQTTKGLFNVRLGDTTDLPNALFEGSVNRFVGVKVGGDPEAAPRTRLISVPFAFHALKSDSAATAIVSLDLTCTGCVGTGDIDATQVQRRVTGTAPVGEYITAILQDGSVATASDQVGTPSGWTDDGAIVRLSTGTDNVGIGTNSPNEQLTVAGSMEVGTSAGDYEHLRIGGGNSSGMLYGSFPKYGDGIHLGYNYYANAAGSPVVLNTGGATSRLSLGYGYIGMFVGGVNAEPTLGILLTGSGNVGIGTSFPGFKLDVAGSAHATSFPTSSDIRLKKNVEPLSDVLEKIEKIRGVSFDWNETYEKMGRSSGHREIGVIAQDVEAVFPELVSKWGDENYRGVDYGRMTAVLIEAVKELNKKSTEVDELKARIGELEKAIKKLLAKSEKPDQTYTLSQELKGGQVK